MRLLKIKFHLLVFVMIVLGSNVFSQPGESCILDYNPFEINELRYRFGYMGNIVDISSRILEERVKSQKIFIGKLQPQDPNRLFNTKGSPDGTSRTNIKLNVIKEIVGKLDKNIELNIKRCWNSIGTPEVGGEHIFFANEIISGSTKILVSEKWSARVNGIPKNELDKIVKEINDYRDGMKQPIAVGYVIKHKPNPYMEEIDRGFDSRFSWRYSQFKNDWRIKKLQYDPEYAEPQNDVKITARDENGTEFTTKTDAEGRFAFAELPDGKYTLSPEVPTTYRVFGKCRRYDGTEQIKFEVPSPSGQICDRTIRFDVAPVGNIEIELQSEQVSWKNAYVELVWANYEQTWGSPNNPKGFRLENIEYRDNKASFFWNRVLAGKYILKITLGPNDRFYYPGTRDVGKARIFEVKEGEMTKLTATIPTLDRR